MRTQRLDFGLESISRWRLQDENHLPTAGRTAPQFLPRQFALDKILHRPALDERLTDLLKPATIASDLLEVGVLSATRQSTQAILAGAAQSSQGPARTSLAAAAAVLAEEVYLDDAVRSALAALLQG